jgi:hypothetical protein
MVQVFLKLRPLSMTKTWQPAPRRPSGVLHEHRFARTGGADHADVVVAVAFVLERRPKRHLTAATGEQQVRKDRVAVFALQRRQLTAVVGIRRRRFMA